MAKGADAGSKRKRAASATKVNKVKVLTDDDDAATSSGTAATPKAGPTKPSRHVARRDTEGDVDRLLDDGPFKHLSHWTNTDLPVDTRTLGSVTIWARSGRPNLPDIVWHTVPRAP